MIRPTCFGFNPETAKDNKFMINDENISNPTELAKGQFEEMVANLESNGIKVEVRSQCNELAYDSVFPNNWLSTHRNKNIPDGLLVIYPMARESRRLERNPEIIAELKKEYKNFLDLTDLESEDQFLESTGSLIFDNEFRKIYINISVRATEDAIERFLKGLNQYTLENYEPVPFHALDSMGNPVYHTNVMLAILSKHVIVCLDSVRDKDERATLLNSLKQSGRQIIDISLDEMNSFCGNGLNLRSSKGEDCVILSKTAVENLSSLSLRELKANYNVISSDISIIERLAGGSARCLVAELF
jgi:hypothetical protein